MRQIIKRIAAVGTTAALATMTIGGALAADLTNFKTTFEGSGTAVVIGDGVTADEAAQTTLYEYLGGTTEEDDTTTYEAIEIQKENVKLGDNIANSNALDTVYTDDDGFTELQDSTISIGGTTYDYHDEIQILSTNRSLDVETSLSGLPEVGIDDEYEDNVGLEIAKDALKYCWVFDKAINISNKVSSANPWDMTFLGKSLKVTSIGDNDTLTAEVGDRYVMNPGDTITIDGVDIELVSSDATSAILNVGTDEGRSLSEGNTITYGDLDIYLSSATDATVKEDKVVVLIAGKDAVKTYNDADSFRDYCSPEGGFGYSGCSESDPDWVWDIKGLTASTSGTTLGSDVTTNALCLENDYVADDWNDGVPSIGEAYAYPDNFASVGIDALTVSDTEYLEVKVEYDSSSDLSNALSSATSNATIFINAPRDEAFEILQANFSNTSLTSNVKTDKIWLFRHGTSGDNSIQIFYEDSDNKVREAGNLSRTNTTAVVNDPAVFARMNYADTKGTDMTIGLHGNLSKANAAWLGFIPGQSLITGDSLWVQLKFTGAGTAGPFAGLGASANSAEAAELAYDVVDPGFATSANQIGTKDENHRTRYGTIVVDPKSKLGGDDFVVKMPADQVKASTAVWQGAFKGSAVSADDEEDDTTATGVPELLEAADVTDVEAQHLVLVGGPCVNALTAQFLGLAEGTCGEASGLTVDEAVVSMVANGEKYAALVYGWEASDTQRAANAVSDETLGAESGDMEVSV